MKIEPEITMRLIDKLKAHKGIKSLKLKWYLVPHPDDNNALLFITRKKLKEYPDCDFLGGSLLLDLVKTDMNVQIDNLFLSLEDMIEADKKGE